uniref:Inhibitor I9 domain-containing protein n=1 Tax=Cucumis sativus TaxID=3659 RepID=A0A0A0LAV3_CUCSA
MLKLRFILTSIFLFVATVSSTNNADRQVKTNPTAALHGGFRHLPATAYVVYMGALPKLESHEVLSDHHHSLLANAVGE